MKLLVWLLHHFFRSAWAKYILGIPFSLYYFVAYLFNAKMTKRVNTNYKRTMDISKLESLNKFFRMWKAYKMDGKLGLLDHDNSLLEFYNNGGDCDDVAREAVRLLKRMGYKAKRIVIMGRGGYSGKLAWHFDCLFFDNGFWSCFNYGNTVEGGTQIHAVANLNDKWKNFFGKEHIFVTCIPFFEYLLGGLVTLGILTGIISLSIFILNRILSWI